MALDEGAVFDKRTWSRLVVISLAVTLSEPVYVIVCYVLKVAYGDGDFAGFMGAEAGEFALLYRWHAVALAVVLTGASFVFRKILFNSLVSAAGNLREQEGGQERIERIYFTMVMMSMSLCEAVGVLGLLYFLATGELMHSTIFFALAFAAKYGHWPKLSELRRLKEQGPG